MTPEYSFYCPSESAEGRFKSNDVAFPSTELSGVVNALKASRMTVGARFSTRHRILTIPDVNHGTVKSSLRQSGCFDPLKHSFPPYHFV